MRRARLTLPLAASLFIGLIAHASAFDLQGHRGARGLAPENTLPAFAKALALGVTTLELDVAVTRDDVLVVSHDLRLNPDLTRDADGQYLSGARPAIRSLTLTEIRRYDVGRLRPDSRYAAGFPEQQAVDGTRIPTLAEVFDLARRSGAGTVRFNVETKITPTSGDETPAPDVFARAVAAAVRKAGLGERVIVQSFDWRTLRALAAIAPGIRRACLTSEGRFDTVRRGQDGPSPWTAGLDVDAFGGSTPRLVQAAGCAIWSPAFKDLSESSLAEARALGLSVIPWTVNEPADMQRLAAWKVDGLITDYPDRARRVLSAQGVALPAPIATR